MFGMVINALKTGGTILTGAGVAAAAAGGTEMYVRGKDSFTADVIRDVQEGIGGAGAEANQGILKTNLFSFLKMVGELLMTVTNGQYGQGLIDMGNRGINYDSDRDGAPEAAAPGADDPAAPAGTAPATTATGNVLDSSNEFSRANLLSTEEFDTLPEIGHKVGLVAQGAVSETLSIGSSAVGHVADFGDWAFGKAAGLVGIDTGHETRDLSADFHGAVMNNIAPKPELTTAWDRVAFGAGQIGTYFIPGAVAARGTALAVSGGAAISTAFTPDS